MGDLEGISVKARNYKCLGDEEQGFDKILPINVIIGKNNSGKSTLLEVLEQAVRPKPEFWQLGHGANAPALVLTHPLKERELKTVFARKWEYGQRWEGKPITYVLQDKQTPTPVSVDPPFGNVPQGDAYLQALAQQTENPLSRKIFKHLRAERNVVPEENQESGHVSEDGSGATSIIQCLVNDASRSRELVEVTLLDELNRIYQPDSKFQRILPQRIGADKWEIYLEELTKGQIALSHTGSGFKTILLVLVLLHLVPAFGKNKKKQMGDYIFAFEELENNLHPALQRRLLSYLRAFALEHGCHFFLTTHSNVAIDLFSRDSHAQLIHVTHDGKEAKAKPVQTYVDGKSILDDLDVRASDLLQANCVVWVEGPSDRLYFNRWVELWEKGDLKEGIHYQCMFYGGRLLKHISAEDPDKVGDEAVSILRLNSHAVLLMDSDKTGPRGRIRKTAKRVSEEIKKMGGIAWITSGREIESYIPHEALALRYPELSLDPLGQFEDIAEYLRSNVGTDESKRFERSKVDYAANLCPMLTREHLLHTYDLSQWLEKVCSKIRQWNRIQENGDTLQS